MEGLSSDRNMEIKKFLFWKLGVMVLAFIGSSYSTLSPTGVNFEGKTFFHSENYISICIAVGKFLFLLIFCVDDGD